jgi:hypothetical protein
MSEFLTSAWIAELDTSARRVALPPELGSLTVEQSVRGGPHGDVRYHLAISRSSIRVVEGAADDADVRFLVDYETAVALHRGELTLQEAISSGRCRLHGPLQRLRGREALLRGLDDVFATVRAATTYS